MSEGAGTAEAGQPSSRATLGLTGLDHQRDGADRARRLPLAHLPDPVALRRAHGRAAPCGSASSSRCCSASPRRSATPSSRSSIPGAGSSYFFAEQAFLSQDEGVQVRPHRQVHHRLGEPPLLLGLPGLHGRRDRAPQRLPARTSSSPTPSAAAINSPLFMFLFCIVFALGVAYIAFRGVTGTTGVNMVINIVQITALLVFSVIAIAYRVQHPRGLAAASSSSTARRSTSWSRRSR